ncbi:MAG: hypothetical protein ABIQ39_16500, partial [Ilumatobacteraceae bacterium]
MSSDSDTRRLLLDEVDNPVTAPVATNRARRSRLERWWFPVSIGLLAVAVLVHARVGWVPLGDNALTRMWTAAVGGRHTPLKLPLLRFQALHRPFGHQPVGGIGGGGGRVPLLDFQRGLRAVSQFLQE